MNKCIVWFLDANYVGEFLRIADRQPVLCRYGICVDTYMSQLSTFCKSLSLLFVWTPFLPELGLELQLRFQRGPHHNPEQLTWALIFAAQNVEQCCVEQGGALLRKLTFWYFDGAQPIRWCCVLTPQKYEFLGARDTINTCRRAPKSAA